MKNLLLLLGACLGCILSGAQSTRVRGTINGFYPSKIYLNIHKGSSITRDSAVVVNGKFEFSISVTQIVAARLVTRDPAKKILDKEHDFLIPALQILFFIEPGKDINITGNYADWPIARIAGGINNELQTGYTITNSKNLLKERELLATGFALKNKGDTAGFYTNERDRGELERKNQFAYSQLAEQYPNSILTAFYVYEQLPFIEDERSLEKYFSRFKADTRKSVYGIAIQEKLTDLKGSAIGSTVKNFMVIGKDSIINLEAYRGKVILLDFWGSWCIPCRQANPHLKQLYDTYKDKGFEIIGIAHEKGERGKENWIKAIQKDELPWINILNSDAIEKNRVNLVERFSIDSYPTKILIDKKGKILLKTGSDMQQLEQLLKEHLL